MEKNKKRLGFLLYGLVLFGYFLFIFNWVIMNKLKGSVSDNTGWMGSFFENTPKTTTTQAVNYTITAMRGLGAIGSGIVIAKLGHKKSVLIAMALVCVAFPAVAIGYWHAESGFWLFIIGRMLMAVGGTVLIVYTQPIISRYFAPKEKTVLSRVNSVGFNLGAALPLILFSVPAIRTSMLENWQIWAFIASAIPVILLTIYWIKGEDFEIKGTAKGFENQKIETRPSTWSNVMKSKDTWAISIFFGAWIVSVVAVILITPTHFADIHAANLGNKLDVWEKLLPIILFLFGLGLGIPLIGWVLKSNIDRRIYIAAVMVLGISSLVAAYLCTAYVESVAPTCIFMFLAGIFLWGIQGVILNIPHEDKTNSPQRVSIVISFAWGIGYLIYTIVNIILAVIFDAFDITNKVAAGWTQFGMAVFVMALSIPAVLFVQKTRNGKLTTIFSEIKKLRK